MLYIDRTTPSRLFLLPIAPSIFLFLFSTNFSRSNAPERGILKKAVEKKTGRSFSPSISLFHGKGTLNINTREREKERSESTVRQSGSRFIAQGNFRLCPVHRAVKRSSFFCRYVAAGRNKEAKPLEAEERIVSFLRYRARRITSPIVRLRCAFFTIPRCGRRNKKADKRFYTGRKYYRMLSINRDDEDAWKFWRRELFLND